MSIGEKIRERRVEVGLTQTALADRVSVSVPMICMLERGSKSPSLALGKAIADALGCSVTDFLDDEPVRQAAGTERG